MAYNTQNIQRVVREHSADAHVFAFEGRDTARLMVQVVGDNGIASATMNITPDGLREFAQHCEDVANAVERGES